jgi:hypothetical protein
MAIAKDLSGNSPDNAPGIDIHIASGQCVRILDANGNPITFSPNAAPNGLTVTRVNAAATTNLTNLKVGAGNIYELDLFNVAAYDVFVKIYDKASAPVLANDVPKWTIPLKAGTGYSKSFSAGVTGTIDWI